MLKRALNVGFSGGEKKRAEILQMALLKPKMCILDETDSGLDIDALQVVSEGVNALRAPDRSMLVITHYQRLLNHIVPDVVHVFSDGKVVESGGKELALELEAKGYAGFDEAAAKGMTMHVPVRLGPAENKLIEQLHGRRRRRRGRAAELAPGLPTRRVEAYHYTDLKKLLRVGAAELAGAAVLEASAPGAARCRRLPAA